ncbi:GNAT family N-acetyltransferase [Amphritea sp. HPY]|uniref:GNAT family N-acetyltransferase n=1 Tax=Amphritea sp. HPY TaxID=3421652 RepID=UPI003D7EABDA
MKIIRADKTDIPDVARLFDLYRQFYRCDTDLTLATRFISERIENGESVIFIAVEDGSVIGFVQLYPSFCSVDAIKIFILYDLFVESGRRKSGTGKMLMEQAAVFACEHGAARIDLLTGKDNTPGQRLYEKLGFQRTNEDFYAYSLNL